MVRLRWRAEAPALGELPQTHEYLSPRREAEPLGFASVRPLLHVDCYRYSNTIHAIVHVPPSPTGMKNILLAIFTPPLGDWMVWS